MGWPTASIDAAANKRRRDAEHALTPARPAEVLRARPAVAAPDLAGMRNLGRADVQHDRPASPTAAGGARRRPAQTL